MLLSLSISLLAQNLNESLSKALGNRVNCAGSHLCNVWKITWGRNSGYQDCYGVLIPSSQNHFKPSAFYILNCLHLASITLCNKYWSVASPPHAFSLYFVKRNTHSLCFYCNRKTEQNMCCIISHILLASKVHQGPKLHPHPAPVIPRGFIANTMHCVPLSNT